MLIESKPYEDKLVLVKNVYMRCKIIDLHVNKQLLNTVTYFNKLAKIVSEQIISTKVEKNLREGKKDENIYEHNLSEIKKILSLAR